MAERIPSNLEQTVRKRFTELFEKDKKIETVYKKIRQGRATYADASLFSKEIGTILSDVFKTVELNPANIAELTDYIIENALTQNIALSNLVCESVQSTLNEAAGVGLNPVQPEVNKGKIKGIRNLVEEAEDENAIRIALDKPVITNVMQNVDDWVKTNIDFQADAGLQPIIVRTWSGSYPSHDTRHTDWCEELAGTWNYGDEPEDVYKRHEGCTCTVEYFPNKKAKGRITALAKGEKDTEGVLWNTGGSKKQQAIIEQRRNITGKNEAHEILSSAW